MGGNSQPQAAGQNPYGNSNPYTPGGVTDQVNTMRRDQGLRYNPSVIGGSGAPLQAGPQGAKGGGPPIMGSPQAGPYQHTSGTPSWMGSIGQPGQQPSPQPQSGAPGGPQGGKGGSNPNPYQQNANRWSGLNQRIQNFNAQSGQPGNTK